MTRIYLTVSFQPLITMLICVQTATLIILMEVLPPWCSVLFYVICFPKYLAQQLPNYFGHTAQWRFYYNNFLIVFSSLVSRSRANHSVNRCFSKSENVVKWPCFIAWVESFLVSHTSSEGHLHHGLGVDGWFCLSTFNSCAPLQKVPLRRWDCL